MIAAVVVTLLSILMMSSGPASAEAPVDVQGPVTDRAQALGGDAAAVRDALDSFFEKTGNQLFVVYVSSFDGMDGQEWAERSAKASRLGTTDILLAVATDERSFGVGVSSETDLSDDDLEKVQQDDILPALRDNEWSKAAIDAAGGYTAALDDSGISWVPIIIGGVAVVGVGAFAVTRIRRRYDRSHVVLDEHGNPVDPLSQLSDKELDARASSALVAVDDALTTSQQELGFAEAQFGVEATRVFATVIADGRTTVQKAFELRQQLDDDVPEDDATRRRMTAEIVRLCEKVDGLLDEQVESFDALRALQERAPEVLADLATRAAEINRRVPQGSTVLGQLSSSYPATALASVAGNVDQAAALVAAAEQQVGLGQTALTTDDRATAVTHARAAEDSLAQAVTLLDAVDTADADLKAAAGLIAERLTSLGADVDDTTRLAPGDAGVAAAATATAREAMSYATLPDHDPLAAVQRLAQAEAALDDLLAGPRAAAAEAQKARVALNDSLGRVTSRVRAVSEFVETRRGAVGAPARTRLSEAARHLDHAQQVLETDPPAALKALQEADRLLDEAEGLAQQDVSAFDRQQRGSGGGSGLESLILGGILLGGNRSSGSGRSSSSSRRSPSPGSFGGSGTRSRRGRGGRF